MSTPSIIDSYSRLFSFHSRIQILAFCASSICLSGLAQNSTPNAATIVAEEQGDTFVSGPFVSANVSRTAANLADIINLPPPALEEGEEIPAWVPPVVAAYLPRLDTNVGIGIWYPAGSREFPYLVAGIRPPGGDPRLPPTEEEEANNIVPPPPIGPLVIYHQAERWLRAVNTREIETELVRDLPPGAVVRATVSPMPASATTSTPPGVPQPAGRARIIAYYEPTMTDTGEDLVQNFPPGAFLLKK